MAFRPFCKGRALPLCTSIGVCVCVPGCKCASVRVYLWLGLLHNNMDAVDAFSSIKRKMFGVQFAFVAARWRTFSYKLRGGADHP